MELASFDPSSAQNTEVTFRFFGKCLHFRLTWPAKWSVNLSTVSGCLYFVPQLKESFLYVQTFILCI